MFERSYRFTCELCGMDFESNTLLSQEEDVLCPACILQYEKDGSLEEDDIIPDDNITDYDDTSIAEDPFSVVIVTSSKLNVRKGPSKDFPILKIVTKDTRLTIFKEQDGFGAINPDLSNWIDLDFTKQVD